MLIMMCAFFLCLLLIIIRNNNNNTVVNYNIYIFSFSSPPPSPVVITSCGTSRTCASVSTSAVHGNNKHAMLGLIDLPGHPALIPTIEYCTSTFS